MKRNVRTCDICGKEILSRDYWNPFTRRRYVIYEYEVDGDNKDMLWIHRGRQHKRKLDICENCMTSIRIATRQVKEKEKNK